MLTLSLCEKETTIMEGEEKGVKLKVEMTPLNGCGEETTIREGGEKGVTLKAEMTLLNGCGVIVGCIIGSGIFVSPTGVLVSTGSVNMSLIVWTICGLFTMIGAYCYAELGCMITKSGADYAYIMVTFGPFLAFLRLWIECMIVRPCSLAIQALTFSLYILKPLFPECDPPPAATRLLAAVCLCLVGFINCYRVKWANLVQDYLTYAKVFALLIICSTGLVQLGKGHVEHFTWQDTESDPATLTLSLYSGLFAFSGWNNLNFIIEEMKNPVRDLPRAIAISCTICMLIYLLTIVAFHTTLSPTEVLGSEAVAVTFAQRLYGRMAWIIPIFVALSTFGGVNGNILTTSRLFFAGAREGQMPNILSMIQIQKVTPLPSVVVITVIGLMYLVSSDIIQLINYCSFSIWLSIGAAVFCVPYLRWKCPHLNRPIKVSLIFPITYLILTALILVLPAIVKPLETAIGIAMILTGVPVYFLLISWKSKPSWWNNCIGDGTNWLQCLLMVTPPSTHEE